jgi:hypothetical protein
VTASAVTAVSIGAELDGTSSPASCTPGVGATYTAVRGAGARLERRRPLRVSAVTDLPFALVARLRYAASVARTGEIAAARCA